MTPVLGIRTDEHQSAFQVAAIGAGSACGHFTLQRRGRILIPITQAVITFRARRVDVIPKPDVEGQFLGHSPIILDVDACIGAGRGCIEAMRDRPAIAGQTEEERCQTITFRGYRGRVHHALREACAKTIRPGRVTQLCEVEEELPPFAARAYGVLIQNFRYVTTNDVRHRTVQQGGESGLP